MTTATIKAIKKLVNRLETGGSVPLQDIREELLGIIRGAKAAATSPRDTSNLIVIMNVEQFNCGAPPRTRNGNEGMDYQATPSAVA